MSPKLAYTFFDVWSALLIFIFHQLGLHNFIATYINFVFLLVLMSRQRGGIVISSPSSFVSDAVLQQQELSKKSVVAMLTKVESRSDTDLLARGTFNMLEVPVVIEYPIVAASISALEGGLSFAQTAMSEPFFGQSTQLGSEVERRLFLQACIEEFTIGNRIAEAREATALFSISDSDLNKDIDELRSVAIIFG